MTNLAEKIENVRQKAANRKSLFLSYAMNMDMALLTKQYQEIRSDAPRRHLKNRKYLFDPNRSGIPSSIKSSNRAEEHLAIALYQKFRQPDAMILPTGQRLEILDYQVPLKASGSDNKVGKVDMLGLIDDRRLSVLELKWKGGDTPLAATLEALVYAALLEPNLRDIREEMTSAGYMDLDENSLDIIVLGRSDYWQDYDLYDENWLRKLEPVLTRIASALSIVVHFIELETGSLEMGHSGLAPKLDGEVKLESLYCSMTR
jgi:hypothetical protein